MEHHLLAAVDHHRPGERTHGLPDLVVELPEDDRHRGQSPVLHPDAVLGDIGQVGGTGSDTECVEEAVVCSP